MLRMKGASDLPSDIWIQILNLLDEEDVAQVSLASKQFLFLTNSVWKKLTIWSKTLPILPRVLQRCRCFETIIIYTNSLMNSFDSLCQVYSSSSGQEATKRIKRLYFQNSSGYFLPEITKILDLFPWLEEISFGSSPNCAPVKQCHALERMASKLTMLKKVTFEGKYFLSDECLTFLSSNCFMILEEFHMTKGLCNVGEKTIGFILRNNPKLTTLTLSKIHHKCLPDDPLSMANSMPYAKHLHTLSFYSQNLSKELTHSLVKRNASLKKLEIQFDFSDEYGDIQTNYLPTIFRECCSIEDVCIKSNRWLTDSLIDLILPYLAKLTRINLERSSKLSNQSFSVLTKYCPLLEKVMMGYTSIGLGKLSPMNLHKHNRLGKLCFKGNIHLDNDTLKTIIGICPNLQYLDVSDCSCLKVEDVLGILRNSAVDLLTQLNINYVSSKFSIYEGSRTIKLKKLEAKGSGLNDKALGEIGKICSGLEVLDISDCKKVTDIGVIEIMKNCKNLKSIKFHYRDDVSNKILDTMMNLGIRIPQIFVPIVFFLSEEKRKLIWDNGCKISSCSYEYRYY